MYEGFYNLSKKPFQLNADTDFFFNSEVHRRALAYMRYGLKQGEGFGPQVDSFRSLPEKLVLGVEGKDVKSDLFSACLHFSITPKLHYSYMISCSRQ